MLITISGGQVDEKSSVQQPQAAGENHRVLEKQYKLLLNTSDQALRLGMSVLSDGFSKAVRLSEYARTDLPIDLNLSCPRLD